MINYETIIFLLQLLNINGIDNNYVFYFILFYFKSETI